MYEYVGAIHMHSIFSDGSGKVEDIASYADEVGLDYIILTDHNTLRALDEGYEKWYGNTLLLVGFEINDKENKNHYLALGLNKTFSTRLPAVKYVKKIKEEGGIGFIAHPHEKRSSMKQHPPYPWEAWESKDFTGIEIWNHMSEWMEGLTDQNKYNFFMHPLRSIVAPPEETLKVWDELSAERKIVGIGGVDAHAHKVNLLGLVEVEVFPYKVLFKSIRTHILAKEKIKTPDKKSSVEKSKRVIYDALENGRCFVSNSYHGDAAGFRFYAKEGHKTFNMGDSIQLKDKLKLKVILPNIKGTIKLIRNGILIDEVDNLNADFFVDQKGVYRVEVYLDGKAWIFSNHIRIN